MDTPTLRLFVAADLVAGAAIELSAEPAHYLRNVMRRAVGDAVAAFNGRDGEWRCVIAALGKARATLRVEARLRAPAAEPDLWLLAAPIKRAGLDFVAAKATELGVSAIRPVMTRRTVVARVNVARLAANAVEAAEQCGRLAVPRVWEPLPLAAALAALPDGRRLLLCDESGAGRPIAAALADERARMPEPWAVLVGPEGGFAPEERAAARARPGTLAVSLGARLLRADTAALAALAVWQAVLGDWRG